MRNRVKDIPKSLLNMFPSEMRVGIALFLMSIILYVISPGKVLSALRDNVNLAVNIILLTVGAIILSFLVERFVSTEFVAQHLAGSRKRHLLYATILGILTPGPVYAIYPIVLSLKSKGLPNHIIVSYLTGQTIIGPARIPFEVGLLGPKFFFYRIVISIFIGALAGYLYLWFSKILPDRS